MAFSEETQANYLAAGGNECPYCEGRDITAGTREADSDYISQEVHCENCGKIWLEVYTLSGIEEKNVSAHQ